jgi:hypothetical protein
MVNSRIFKPGDLVPVSGVYAALHSTPHSLNVQQELFGGGRFPGCRICPLGVWYRLQNQAIPSLPSNLPAIPRNSFQFFPNYAELASALARRALVLASPFSATTKLALQPT